MNLITKLRHDISIAEARILEIQRGCPHPEIAVIMRSIGRDTDGDVFRNCTCGLCEAEFTRGPANDH